MDKDKWHLTNIYLVGLGMDICFGRNPNCVECDLNKLCEFGISQLKNKSKSKVVKRNKEKDNSNSNSKSKLKTKSLVNKRKK